MTRLRIFYVAVVFSLIWIVSSVACGYRMTVSESEIKDRIDREIPPGSSASQVLAFLDSLQINGLKAVHTPFISEKPTGTNRPKLDTVDARGYLMATIKNAGRDDRKLQVYRIEIFFYFDKDERLIDYRTQTLGDW